jgi:Zn-finger nucleic acid-binding protein
MEPVFLGGAELDRCYTDELIWLDEHEHERVLASARAQRRGADASWVLRLLAWLRSAER